MKNQKKEKYLWLNISHSAAEYIGSEYYNQLLKDYIFQGKSDLQHFCDYLKDLPFLGNVLELGAGNGRATKIFLKKCGYKKLTLVDLSNSMLNGAKEGLLKKGKNIRYVQADIISYILKSREKFDFIYTLWSFSHSVHQHLDRLGLKRGRWMIKNTLKKMVTDNMHKGSHFYLVHFDSLSDEQRILLRQWKRKMPIFRYVNMQSPSKRYIDESLKEMEKDGIIRCKIAHYEGKAIKYNSTEEVLEIFMNFHLESLFNKKGKLTNLVLRDIERYLKKYHLLDGTICVKPGCFIYSITKTI